MTKDTWVWIFITAVALALAIHYWRLRRPEKIKPRVTFSERARPEPKTFEYVLNILPQLEATDAEVLKRYLDANESPPGTDVALLDLIDKHLSWQRIADWRVGTVGNPHADEVIHLERIYAAVQQITGPVPSAKREQLHAAFTNHH